MKRILALLLVLSMLFALTACSGDDNNQTGNNDPTTGGETEEVFEPQPTKYGRNEFLSRVESYVASHTPDRKYHYDEGFDPEQENGFKEVYYVKDFTEEDELNLFLHEINMTEGSQMSGWIVIDQFRYEFIPRTTYSISVFYTIPCATLEEAIGYAKNDAYRVAPFYGLEPAAMKFYTNAGNEKKEIRLTDEDFQKLVAGEYTGIIGIPSGTLIGEDACRIEVKITQAKDGTYEYTCCLRIVTDT